MVWQQDQATEQRTAKSIGGDQFGSWAHVNVLLLTGQRVVCNKLVGDDLDANQLAHTEQVGAGHTQQEGDGVADVAENELQGEIRSAVLGNIVISKSDTVSLGVTPFPGQ